jgi:GH15 family glucan-1,4-alpha-glucosidase
MSKLFLVFLLFIFLLHPLLLQAQVIELDGPWLFKTGDQAEFELSIFADSSWVRVQVPSHWEKQGFPDYDGIAWYRLHFVADRKYFGKELYLLLGKIDDCDETYLNGNLIGSSGKFPPESESAWNEQRAYRLPPGTLRENNVLAIRVYDQGGPGGIVGGTIGIFDKKGYNQELSLEPPPKKSFYQLVTANGLIAAVYNEKQHRIESVWPDIFQAYDSGQYVSPFISRLKLQTAQQPKRTYYLDNTHIIAVDYPDFQVRYFAPFSSAEKIFYSVIIGKKQKVDPLRFECDAVSVEILKDTMQIELGDGSVEKYFLFSFIDSLQRDKDILVKAKNRLLNSPTALLQKEENYMKTVFSRCPIPSGLKQDERNLLEQSVSVLKMAQVPSSEIFPKAAGQIVASLPPGGWNITWIRDGAYAVLGLNALGLFEEAKNALTFFLNADAGYYRQYVHSDGKDYGVGMDYQISVCRYFGTGKEESDYNQDGPNIELDGFGLFLVIFCDYLEKSGDEKFFRLYYPQVSSKVADVLVSLIQSNGLIRIDSGPWERHLPGKQFAYTSITAAAGLTKFAEICQKYKTGNPLKYSHAASYLINNIKTRLVTDKNIIKGNVEITDPTARDFYDGGTFEAFALGLFDDHNFFLSHFAEYQRQLGIPGKSSGFSRINQGDWYETAEWLLLDFRIAYCLNKFGEPEEARKIMNWITSQSRLNFNLIPELFDWKTGKYDGAVPMVGFGAGAYVVTLLEFKK